MNGSEDPVAVKTAQSSSATPTAILHTPTQSQPQQQQQQQNVVSGILCHEPLPRKFKKVTEVSERLANDKIIMSSHENLVIYKFLGEILVTQNIDHFINF